MLCVVDREVDIGREYAWYILIVVMQCINIVSVSNDVRIWKEVAYMNIKLYSYYECCEEW